MLFRLRILFNRVPNCRSFNESGCNKDRAVIDDCPTGWIGKVAFSKNKVQCQNRPNPGPRFAKKLGQEKSGRRGIRTPGRVTPTPVFKTGAFNQTQPSLHGFCRVCRFPRQIVTPFFGSATTRSISLTPRCEELSVDTPPNHCDTEVMRVTHSTKKLSAQKPD